MVGRYWMLTLVFFIFVTGSSMAGSPMTKVGGNIEKKGTIPVGSLLFVIESTQVSQQYQVVERKMLNKALILSVTTKNMDNAEKIAQELINQNSGQLMIRVFFYVPSSKPGRDTALIRYEWTKKGGLVKSFDLRLPPSKKELNQNLPDYKVLFKVKMMHNKRVYGDVLIPSLSRANPIKGLEQIARKISKQEELDDVVMYSTEDAYKANESAAFLKAHPNALKKGYLGVFREGVFTPGEKVFP